jgi:hypothetical protein
MTTKKIISCIIFLIGFFSCSQSQVNNRIINKKVYDNYLPVKTTKQISDELELAFKRNQQDSLSQIFIDWNKNVKPNSDSFIYQNDTISAVFGVFKEFYKPLDLLKLGDWEWGNDLNSNSKYVVVQNKIFYTILADNKIDDQESAKLKFDSIINFRPPINMENEKVLYLTKEYAKSINIFLGTESTKLGEGGIMNPSRPAGESEKRYLFLRHYIPILHGHWGGYWHISTHPEISYIIFTL